MKDHAGAEFAMREADKKWKSQIPQRKPPAAPPSRVSMQTPVSQQQRSVPMSSMHPMMQSGGHHHHYPPGSAQHQYLPIMGQPMGYSPMGVPMTPSYGMGHHDPRNFPPQQTLIAPAPTAPKTEPKDPKRTVPEITPGAALSSEPRKKRKASVKVATITFPYFGSKVPEQPRKTAIKILAFLSKQDLNRASLVSKLWRETARDEELSEL
jgi:hypothetical protein